MNETALETNTASISAQMNALADTGARAVGLYNCGLFDWYSNWNITSGKTFCETVYPVAKQRNLKLLIGYFSNSTQDWTQSATISRATSQFQALVKDTMTNTNVYAYLIGNEVFEQLPTQESRQAYASWIGSMVDWTAKTAPGKQVLYADNSNLVALPYLKTSAPHLTTYTINDYEWDTLAGLLARIDRVTTQWPGISVLLHEYGSDSFDVRTMSENQTTQADRLIQMTSIVEQASRLRPNTFAGAFLFAFTDDWSKIGDPNQATPDAGQSWVCLTCFDQKANEDYWGIYNKPAYGALKNFWQGLGI